MATTPGRGRDLVDNRPVDGNAVARGGRWPAGSKGLYREVKDDKTGKMLREPLDPDEFVDVINMSFGNLFVKIRDEESKPKDGKVFVKTLKIKPFEKLQMRVSDAKRVFITQEKPGGTAKLLLAPRDGDCGGRDSFDQDGQQFQTCSFAHCKTCGPLPPNVVWSVFYGQHFIRRLGTEPAMMRFLRLDIRTNVYMFGMATIEERRRAREERMGRVSRRTTDTVY